MITRNLDDRDGIILVTVVGVSTREDVDRHYAELERVLAANRRAGMPIRVLSDLTQGEQQTPEIEAYIKARMAAAYAAGDRVAIVVAGVDVKMHVRGLLGDADVGVFNSRLPAEMWLMEDGLKPPA